MLPPGDPEGAHRPTGGSAEGDLPTEADPPGEAERPAEVERPAEAGVMAEVEHPTEAGAMVEAEHPTEAGAMVEAEHPTEAGAMAEAEHPAEAGAMAEAEHPAEAGAMAEAEHPAEASPAESATRDAPPAGAPSGPAVVGTQPAATPTRTWPPSASLISRGLDLVVRATGQLRPASLALGLQVLGVVGPLVVLVLVMVDRDRLDALRALVDPGYPVTLDDQQLESLIGFGLFLAFFGSTAILVEGRLIAVALMGGRLVGRPILLHEALRRSRQTFWRSIRAAFIVQVPITLIGSVLGAQAEAAGIDPFGGSILSGIVTTVLTAPFAYATTGIVLGDVGAIESLRRSVRLARVRWRFAFVVAFFAAIAQLLLVFGLSAGLDALARVSDFLGLGLSGGALSTFGTLVVVLSAVVAIGTLVFTVNAVVVAPEVVAFVGLTGVTAGLDAAREPAPGAARDVVEGNWGTRPRVRPVRWLSIPMGIGIALAILLSVTGVAAVVRPS